VSAKMATLIELQTIYGTRDAFDMLEVLIVDQANERKMRQRQKS